LEGYMRKKKKIKIRKEQTSRFGVLTKEKNTDNKERRKNK
jgi:hypothetical protein